MLSSLGLALALVVTRRAVFRTGESYSPVVISSFLALVVFASVLLIRRETDGLLSLSWVGLTALAGAGIMHFIIGRWAAFASTRLIGANRSSPIVSSNTLIASILGVVFFGEIMTVPLVIAILVVVAGVVLISTTGKSEGASGQRVLTRGILIALGGALAWSLSPILVKIGLNEVNPVQSIFVSFAASSVVIGASLFHPNNARKVFRLDRVSLFLIIISAILTSTAQLLKYAALDHSPVSVVVPLVATHTLLVLIVSFVINKKIEVFHPRVIVGALAIVACVFLIFLTA